MNRKQCRLLVQRHIKAKYQQLAVEAVIFDGMTAYAAEQRYGCTDNTVNKDVKRIKEYWAFHRKLTKSGNKAPPTPVALKKPKGQTDDATSSQEA